MFSIGVSFKCAALEHGRGISDVCLPTSSVDFTVSFGDLLRLIMNMVHTTKIFKKRLFQLKQSKKWEQRFAAKIMLYMCLIKFSYCGWIRGQPRIPRLWPRKYFSASASLWPRPRKVLKTSASFLPRPRRGCPRRGRGLRGPASGLGRPWIIWFLYKMFTFLVRKSYGFGGPENLCFPTVKKKVVTYKMLYVIFESTAKTRNCT